MQNPTNMLNLISLDWFQGVVLHDTPENISFPSNYTREKTKLRTRHFARVDEIYDYNGKVCTLCFQPHSKIIPPNCILLKFDNSYLYRKHTETAIKSFITNSGMKWKGNSRIDIALDFQEFSNKMKPENFLQRVKRDIYLHVGKQKHTFIGTQNVKSYEEYLRYGSGESNVTVYMYNKTYEMIDKTYKSYIVKSWENSGFDMSKDVWRLEFRINNCRQFMVQKDTGLIAGLKGLEILHKELLAELFHVLIGKYFQFKINDYKRNKSRMKGLKLFDAQTPNSYLAEMESMTNNTIQDKALIRRLHEHAHDLRVHKGKETDHFTEAIMQFAIDKNLVGWMQAQNIHL